MNTINIDTIYLYWVLFQYNEKHRHHSWLTVLFSFPFFPEETSLTNWICFQLIQYPERLIGCTGSPADSHEVVWLSATTAKPRHRCTECGSGTRFNPSVNWTFLFIAYFLRFPLVYTLDYQGAEEAAHAH